jgi:hypothetical protein
MAVMSGTSYGNLTFGSDGSFAYQSVTAPPEGGIDSFSYVASDGTLNSNQTFVDIVVDPPSS